MNNLIPIAALLVLNLWPFCLADNANFTPDSGATYEAINLEKAASLVIKKDHNRILGAETERMEDKTVHVIKVLTKQGHVRHFKFNAETGEPIN